jgi:pimeloyl-ACP methyl ester carboxylesterase
MATRKALNPADYIMPLSMNGLNGRMLNLPARNNKKRNILLIYGHHASLERMFGLAEDLNKYGNITMPDLPGFGGMESFYKIHEKPTLDNMADYLAAFVKMRYKRKRVTIVAMSFGFLVVTRMLQRCPELVKKVDLVVSVVGFAHHQDFKFSKRNFRLLRVTSSVFSNRLPAAFVRHVVLRPTMIRLAYKLVADKHSKLKDADEAERKKRINFEIVLWHINDVRTYMDTTITMLKVNLCDKQVKLPVYHVAVANDRYFDNAVVEQHLKVIFSEVNVINSVMPAHAPTVVADAKAAAPFVPAKVRKILAKAP